MPKSKLEIRNLVKRGDVDAVKALRLLRTLAAMDTQTWRRVNKLADPRKE